MTDKQNNPDPIAHAARLLREAAEELRQAHAFPGSEGWENETDAKAAYDEHMAAAQALEDWEAAVGAGGVQALSAAPAGFVPVAAFDRLHAHAESLAARLLAASPTPPAEQQAMESVLVDGAASQPPISNTLWRMLTGGYEHTYILQLPNDSRDRRELIDRACRNWRRICEEIGKSAVASAVSPQTAQAPQQAAPKAAPGEPIKRGKWAWLPVEPSTAMLIAGNHGQPGDFSALKVWQDMIAALDRSADYTRPLDPPTEAAPQQEAQEPCPTCAALARTVMLDQVSFDRKPDCYGIRQITDDEGVEEWEDIRTSPDVAREEANDMMATGRGEIYEVVPLWTTPQPAPAPLSDDAKDAARYRWLRATTNYVTSNGERIDVRNMPEKWDAAIDAALAAQGGRDAG